MSEPRPIGTILAPVIARAAALAGFQSYLACFPSAVDRKREILAAWECGEISDELLISAMMLEAA